MSFVKRLAALLTAVLLLLTATACTEPYPELREYSEALGASAPVAATLESSLDTELGELGAEYIATWSGGALTVTYTKDKLAELTPSSTPGSLLTKEEGTATVAADGTVTGTVSTLVVNVLTCKIILDGEKITYTEANGELEFTVTAENTETVLGVDIGYDVKAKIKLSDESVESISLAYTADSGEATMTCNFEY
ncbi:MAG: hypothetical protein IJW48_01085 [Clostridia bacterium]|nr:hypothetical protein [Clostridia bacterium]